MDGGRDTEYREVLERGLALRPGLAPGAARPVQGYNAHKKHPPPQDHHRSLGIGLPYREVLERGLALHHGLAAAPRRL